MKKKVKKPIEIKPETPRKVIAMFGLPGESFTVDECQVGSITWRGPAVVLPGEELVFCKEQGMVIIFSRVKS